MEINLGVACCGTYDDGDSRGHKILRVLAIRLAVLRYRLLVRRESGCNCQRCEAERAVRLEISHLETEP